MNNPNTIECPKCQTKIEITKAMTAQVESRIRAELESEVDARRASLDERAKVLAERDKSLADARVALDRAKAEIDQKVKDGVETVLATERATIAALARRKAETDLAEERRADAERITELEGKLKQSKQTELDLFKRERALKEKADSLELDVVRRLKDGEDAIRAAAKKQADEEHILKEKEAQEQSAALRRQVEELKRKLEQGSQQAQGEALELVLEEVLKRAFPHDRIDEIAKGVHGADWQQHVVEPSGLECGAILWETKNAKNWNATWLPKLRKDQREAKAAIAVLVTEAMPPDCQHLTEIDGVWICTRACAVTLGAALRAGLVELAKARQAAVGRQGKVERVYDYLSSNEFRQRIGGMVEPLVQMQADLIAEKRAMTRIWAAREKRLEAAVQSMHGLYGDLQGIVGSSTLPTLEQMDLPRLEAGKAENGRTPELAN